MPRALRSPASAPRARFTPLPSRVGAALLLLLLLLLSLACHDRAPDSRASDPGDAPPPPPPPRRPPERRLTHPLTSARWIRGGSEHDTLFSDPLSAVADSDRVYVLDAGADRVVALHTADGRLAWTTNDQGPAGRATHPLHPTAIAPAPGAGVAVADPDHATITTFDRDGHVVRTTPLVGLTTIRSLCTLPDSGYLLAGADPAGALLQLPPAGGTPRPLPLPWPDLATRPALTTQTWLASASHTGSCAVALILGRGFALYDGTRFTTLHPYVEPFDLPDVHTTVEHQDSATTVTSERLTRDRVAAHDVAAGGGQLAVAFDGESEHRSRLLDLYDLASGRYLRSITFPRRVTGVAINGRALFLLFSRAGRPALAAVALPPPDSAVASPPPPAH